MRLTLPTLSGAQIPLAREPESALEATVYVMPLDFLLLGRVLVDAAGAATWKPEPGVTIPATHPDLHLRCDDGVVGLTTLPSVTLDVTVDAAADTAVAAFAVPSWRTEQGNTFPIGAVVDFIPQSVGNEAEAITAIADINDSAGLPANSEWSVWASPAESTLVEIGFKRGASGAYEIPGEIRIPDKYSSSAVIKKGRSEEPELSLDFAHVHSWDGLAAYNGSKVGIALKIVKGRTVATGWEIFTGHRPKASPVRGDGNEEVVQNSTGSYQKHLLGTAL